MKLDNRFFLVIIGSIVLYAIFLLISDFNTISDKVIKLKVEFIPIILFLVACSWMVLFIRWNLLLKHLKIIVPFKANLKIFIAGQALTTTPGQLGELIKSQLLKTKFNIPRTKSTPIVIVEKLYDLVGAVGASLFGIWVLGTGILVIVSASAVLVIIFVLLSSNTNFNKFLKWFNKIKFLSKYSENISESYDVIRLSTRGTITIFATLLSIFFWFITALAVYFVLLSFSINTIDYLDVVSIYSASVILGAISFLPGGIGVTEASLAGLLSLQGIEVSIALLISVMIRIFTLWYGVGIGFLALKMSGGFSWKSTPC